MMKSGVGGKIGLWKVSWRKKAIILEKKLKENAMIQVLEVKCLDVRSYVGGKCHYIGSEVERKCHDIGSEVS